MSLYKRYDLYVSYSDIPIYSASFSSVNLLIKIACGFDRHLCDVTATDIILEKTLPIEEYCQIFQDDINGI